MSEARVSYLEGELNLPACALKHGDSVMATMVEDASRLFPTFLKVEQRAKECVAFGLASSQWAMATRHQFQAEG
eukprot:1524772-Amphidinium_carterae.1